MKGRRSSVIWPCLFDHCTTDPFTTSELQNPSDDVSELHKNSSISWFPGSKIAKGPVGWHEIAGFCLVCIQFVTGWLNINIDTPSFSSILIVWMWNNYVIFIKKAQWKEPQCFFGFQLPKYSRSILWKIKWLFFIPSHTHKKILLLLFCWKGCGL